MGKALLNIRETTRKVFVSILCLSLIAPAQLPQTTPDPQQQPVTVPPVLREQIVNSKIPTPPQSRDADQKTTKEVKKAPQPPTDFQKLIQTATGEVLPIFGADLFEDVPSTFAPVSEIPVPVDYVVGPGDELVLRGWGQVDIDYRAVVDRFGDVYVPKVGNIHVAGLRYGDLQPFVKSQVSRVFRNFELTVTLGQLRSIQVLLVGQVRQPGSFVISSLSTLVNALFVSGGPSNRGSMRSIQLRRANKIVVELDLYSLLLRGDKSKDVQLLPGDIIFVPPVGNQVAVSGAVQVPAIYEMKEGETLGDLIQAAGGLTPVASGQHATLERIDERSKRSVAEVSINDSTLKMPLKGGDFITIRAVTSEFSNAVTLRGNVATPGRFPWRPGMRISDLIPSRDALITRDYWLLQSRVFERIHDDHALTTKGVGRDQTGQPASEEGLRNEIKRLSPEINWDYAVIQRFDRAKLASQLLPFNLGLALANTSDANNLELAPGDVVTIFSQEDLTVPIAKQPKFVRLEGEFNVSGVYQVREGETLKSLIERVGGLTNAAYLFGAEFTRESTRKTQEERLQQFLDRFERDVERAASVRAQNVLAVEEAAGLRAKAESDRALVQKLRTIKPTGRIVLGLKSWRANVTELPDFELEDGDRLVVPYRPATVNVVGAVFNENSFFFEEGRSATYYMNLAGGGTRTADRAHAFIIRADGSVISRKRPAGWFSGGFDGIKIMPGDTVVVPEKLEHTSVLKGLRDWSQVIAQFALGVAALRTLARD